MKPSSRPQDLPLPDTIPFPPEHVLQIPEGPTFWTALDHALGEAVRAETGDETPLSTALWCAMANVAWQHTSGTTFSCTWRAAGAIVAALRREGNYLDWYCCSDDYGTVAPAILEAMAQEGWTPRPD